MTASKLARGGVILLAWTLAACSASPRSQFYTLTPEVYGANEPITPVQFAHSIAVGPVSIPESVNRPQFVVRTGPNRVVVLETHRWAESLKSGIAESVAGYLSRDLDGARVTPMSQSAANTAQFDVSLDVQRFDMIVGDAASMEVVWTIAPRAGESATITGRSNVREPVQPSVDAYDALVAAQVRVLATISREIATRLAQAGMR